MVGSDIFQNVALFFVRRVLYLYTHAFISEARENSENASPAGRGRPFAAPSTLLEGILTTITKYDRKSTLKVSAYLYYWFVLVDITSLLEVCRTKHEGGGGDREKNIPCCMGDVTKRIPPGCGIECLVSGWTSLPQTKLIPGGDC